MKISILTLFPEMFTGVFNHSIIKLAQEKDAVLLEYINIRDFGIGKHQLVDDTPYGGGAGMVMRVDVIASALAKTSSKGRSASGRKSSERVILLDPQGKPFVQKKAQELSKFDHLILICGRYEGVDERVRKLVDEEISVGDYVLTGGEIPAMIMIDTIIRLIPGVIKEESIRDESFSTSNLLEYPQYTRPSEFSGEKVPSILLSGNHKEILEWRQKKALEKTKIHRPDLLT